ncbi:MAG TPA: phage major capsid protein [Dehalococcoidia bacterium]|nr:phage major capsid protein [Dehalococcoidia bacterium]
MALTLTEGAKLSNNVVLQGVVETIVKESPVLQVLPFIDITGNALVYNQENALATAGFFNVGDTWVESTPTFTQQTATLTILGGDADVDNYLRQTRSNVQDIEAVVLELKAKAVRQTWEQQFITGTTAAAGFAGLDVLIGAAPASQTISAGVNGATLTLAMVDQLIDAVKPGMPDMLLMSRRSRRQLTQLVRAAGAFLEGNINQFGMWQERYNGIPIGVSDYISEAQTQGTSNVATTIYALQFGEGRLCGLQGGGGMQVDRVGELETKDAVRWRIKWYVSLAMFGTVCAARLIGVTP